MRGRFAALIVALSFIFVLATPIAYANAEAAVGLDDIITGIINWKKAEVGSDQDGFLINNKFLSQAGSTAGDWYPVALGRLGIQDNSEGYLAVINDCVTKRYAQKDKLDKAKATEWHRISLAVLASGGNPRKLGQSREIDLIADGTYNRVDDDGNGILGKQGINGFIWALIALDTMLYDIPEDAYYTRDDIILNILNRQLSDGGWALTGDKSDPDITAMVLQALAPYYNSEKVYEYRNEALSSDWVRKKARTAVDEGVKRLSELQQDDGDFRSWGTENSESCSQVIIALCSLGIDIFSDKRFITESGKTLYNGLMKYRNADGGFLHSYVYDADNPSADPEKSNSMAGEQVLLSMTALKRFTEGKRRLYDFRPEQSGEIKEQLKTVEEEINKLDEFSSLSEIQRVYGEYLDMDWSERSYVRNYAHLSGLIEFAGLGYVEEQPKYNSGNAEMTPPITYFTEVDKTETEALPTVLTTEYKATILRLWQKICSCEEFEGKFSYYIKLEKAKNEIDAIEVEIEDLKKGILCELYPFDSISLGDKKTVDAIYSRFMRLSEYDRSHFAESDIEGLIKCKKQVDALYLALILSLTFSVAAAIILLGVILHIRKRKKEKLSRQMTESDE